MRVAAAMSTLTALTLSVAFVANAQKLPNIQTGSLRAPANIKVDGKATEWDNKFQAYNHATDVFYTLSNDDNNLYLTIQATDRDVIGKIISGRILFTINKSDKKNDKDAVTVSYPIFDRKDRPALLYRNKPTIIPGSAASLKQADSIMYMNNKNMADKAKYINITGVKGLDTLISVYNDKGIKAVALFDNKAVYTCEIAVALKLVGLSINEPARFSYNVKLNAMVLDDVPGVHVTRSTDGTITSFSVIKAEASRGLVDPMSATDFWGEYTLAKK